MPAPTPAPPSQQPPPPGFPGAGVYANGSAHPAAGARSEVHGLATALRRRPWAALLLLVLLPGIAYFVTARQPPVYSASADVLVPSDQSLNVLVGQPQAGSTPQDVERNLLTQAALAHVPSVAKLAVQRIPGVGLTAEELVASSNIEPRTNTNLLTMSVSADDPGKAIALANAYAEAYVEYRTRALSTQLKTELGRAERQLAVLRSSRSRAKTDATKDALSIQYSTLLTRYSQIRAASEEPQMGTAVVRRADSVEQVAPRPNRNAALALGLAMVLIMAGVVLRRAITTRVTSTDEVLHALGLPLLGRLPAPHSRRRGSALERIASVRGPLAEGFAIVRASLTHNPQWALSKLTVITSATDSEGKSTCAAGLAISLARSGQRVTLVDGDLRHPSVHRLFGVPREPGFSDVVGGSAATDDVLHEFTAAELHRLGGANPGQSGDAISDGQPGILRVLPVGAPVAAPQDLLSRPEAQTVLRGLRERSDAVIIDAAPLVPVGDTLVLAALADGIIVVSAVNKLDRSMLNALRRILGRCPAPRLGLITTGEAEGDLTEYPNVRRYYQHGLR